MCNSFTQVIPIALVQLSSPAIAVGRSPGCLPGAGISAKDGWDMVAGIVARVDASQSDRERRSNRVPVLESCTWTPSRAVTPQVMCCGVYCTTFYDSLEKRTRKMSANRSYRLRTF
ncbi:hypothetical protein BT67DRAFT_234904 [Trichocladium antarcticum]|uniref:Uncharacterized protein n=1 Tax=Trichocladium antarcticum TaxID=1450529 RepID=A0AAN6UNC5_9PEZI|nr:hypothetical protein BT67DRAFT_234904 [Trichocladium antarcticum]